MSAKTAPLRIDTSMQLDSVVVDAGGGGQVFFKCTGEDRHWLDDGLALGDRALDWAAFVGKPARVWIGVEQ